MHLQPNNYTDCDNVTTIYLEIQVSTKDKETQDLMKKFITFYDNNFYQLKFFVFANLSVPFSFS